MSNRKKKKRRLPAANQKRKNTLKKNQLSINSEGITRQDARKSARGRKPNLFIFIGLAIIVALVTVWFFLRDKAVGFNPDGVFSANILLITLDTTRADHLGCYGYKDARTPNLDKLAAEGVRFANVYCPAPLTLPSHVTILTGLEPFQHGVRNNGHYLSSEVKTLTERLKDRGYKTAAFVSAFSVDSRFGLDRGFEVYDDTFAINLPFKTTNSERRAEDTFTRFNRWLNKNPEEKFFCWVHYYDPHLPYDPPEPYRQEFSQNPYDGEIAYMDVYVGKILEALEEKDILNKTVIIIAGDHGEGLGERVEVGHGIFLYEETIRVPLIFWGKGVFSRPAVIEERVRLTDITPTIISLLGFMEEDFDQISGQSLEPHFRKKNQPERDVIIETFYPRENFAWSELVGLISGKWKLIQAPRPELYDLKADPEERINLYQYNQEIASKLKKRLEAMILDSPVPAVTGTGTAEDLEKLSSLGYISLAPVGTVSTYPDPKEMVDLLRLIQQAQALEYQENFSEAEKIYQEILEETPDSPASYINLALAQAQQKKMDLAIETLKKGQERLPDSEIILVRLGHTYLVTGKYWLAFETMQRVLVDNPENVDALTVCASILDAAGRKEEAKNFLERALAIEPESKHLRASLASNLASSGRFEEAIEIYKALINDFPEDQSLYQYTGIAYSYLGDHDQAIFYLKQAVAITPTRSGYFNLAVACEKAGQIKEAAQYFKLYLENSQGDDPEKINLAQKELEKLEKQLRGD